MDVFASPQGLDARLIARERIHAGPVPDWVVGASFDPTFKATQAEPVTYLLMDHEVNAENHQAHTHIAMRLETMKAVETESQWRLSFEPRTMSVTLHWIKIHRGNLEFEHGDLEKVRLLQREEGLDKLAVDGWITLLLLLEDVRPGDILEWCYTTKQEPRFLPQRCACLFRLPEHKPVARFRFAVHFNAERLMKWKSSGAEVKPVEQSQDGRLIWSWTGESYEPAKPEANTPLWHPDHPWLQVSDYPDWGIVARAVSKEWKEEIDDPTVVEVAREIHDANPDVLSRLEKAIRLIQDEYRYLRVDLELGGQVPAPPGIVARRRFGDCKNLCFLLVHLLKRLGVPARPILVHSTLRKSVAGMLPSPNLFNHVVVEYQVQGQTRWVDATMKHQGGGALDPVITDFGVGLPVDQGSTQLIGSPAASLQSDLYELKETLLLDTSGQPSLISVHLHAKGWHAEVLRHQFESVGEEEFAKDRLQLFAKRFFNAVRSGPLLHRDDRDANEFLLAETFEITGFLAMDEDPGLCKLRFANNLVVGSLVMPEEGSRRTPFGLPHPCNLVHTIEVQSTALPATTIQRSRIGNALLQFSRRHKSFSGYLSMSLSLSTLADSVAPEGVAEHRKVVQEIWSESMWEIIVPIGYPRPRRRNDFGDLPLSSRQSRPLPFRPHGGATRVQSDASSTPDSSIVQPAPASEAAVIANSTAAHPTATPRVGAESRPRSQTRRGKRNEKKESLVWPIIIITIVIALIVLFVVVSRPPTR